MDRETACLITQTKNTGLGVVLALVFGGPGVFYGSITGGIIMTLVEVLFLVVAVPLMFFGIGFLLLPLLPVIHGASLVWVIMAIGSHNKKVFKKAGM